MKLRALAHQFDIALETIYPKEEVNALFFIAISHYLNVSRVAYPLHRETEIPGDNLVQLELLLADLKKGRPIQYIIGETVFFGLPFKVNPAVLIPRPETEELVDWILNELQHKALQKPSTEMSLLDIGTGSGCIAISIKKNRTELAVSAIDVSAESLKIAHENALLNEVAVTWIEQDILLRDNDMRTPQYDVIVSNPPYITQNEKSAMHQNVIAHEPHLALFVSNEKPLIFYEAIADFALGKLKEQGMLFFEINEYLGKETIQLLRSKGFKDIILRKDMQGKDRMILAKK